MKQLDYTPITDSSQFFPKKGTLNFLQLAYQEGFAGLIQSLIGPSYSATTVYILNGVNNLLGFPSYNITAGFVFFNGFFYQVNATAFTVTGTNVAVFSIVQTQFTTDADPCTFSDSTVHNIHNILMMQVTQGASGSGVANFSQALHLNLQIPAQFNPSAPTSDPYTGNQLQLAGSYPNIVFFVPPAGNLNPVLTAGSINIGDIPGGGSTDYTVTLPITVATSNYYVQWTVISNGTRGNDCTVVGCISNRTTSSFVLTLHEVAAVVQNIAVEYVIFAK